jgi:hypothetical protein
MLILAQAQKHISLSFLRDADILIHSCPPPVPLTTGTYQAEQHKIKRPGFLLEALIVFTDHAWAKSTKPAFIPFGDATHRRPLQNSRTSS